MQAALEENYIYLVDPLNGEGKAKISPIYVYDSYTGEKTEKNTHDTYNNKTIVKEIEKENSYLITIIVDKEFLNNPETVYPIVIDPKCHYYKCIWQWNKQNDTGCADIQR